MRMKGFVAIAVAGMALLLVSSTAAHADHVIQIHESTELFHASGGTTVSCLNGCSSFTVGDISLPQDWEIIEKGWHDHDATLGVNPGWMGDTTILSYTVGNDGFASPITSFHIPTSATALELLAPTGWMGTQVGNMIWWETIVLNDVTFGIVSGATLDTFIAVYAGHLSIFFQSPAAVDLADGNFLTSDDWYVSTIPVPGAVLLGAIGLAGVGWLKRKVA